MQDINFEFDQDKQMFVKKRKSLKQRIKSFFIWLIILFFVKSMIRLFKRMEEKKRYKRIIKKGVFWDTEYLVEKD